MTLAMFLLQMQAVTVDAPNRAGVFGAITIIVEPPFIHIVIGKDGAGDFIIRNFDIVHGICVAIHFEGLIIVTRIVSPLCHLTQGCAYAITWFSDEAIVEVPRPRQNLLNSSRWIYNDIGEGFAEASRTGKPLMVVLRCVPCKACMGLDAEVLLENNELKPVMDQFVRLRLINANAIDRPRLAVW